MDNDSVPEIGASRDFDVQPCPQGNPQQYKNKQRDGAHLWQSSGARRARG